jgi:hypothetical protein
LRLIYVEINLFPECNDVELIDDDFIEPFADTVRLRMPCLCLPMIHVVESKEELILMSILRKCSWKTCP